ncbi:MAG TPA: hypothetical protein VGR96_09795 [Acidobacteriaceae bacterium]|nr:hypothetical protein [Acidobacteriaceae bacterium]
MKYRYFFFGVGVVFLIFAGVEFARTDNDVAVAVNAITGVIFLFLGFSPPRRTGKS